jgi:predicted transcriptional regulator
MADTDELLRILIQLNGRQAFPEDLLRGKLGASERVLEAYNLCDGTRSQREVAKAVGLDEGQLSRSVKKWISEGILFKLGTERDTRLLHLYRVAKESMRNPKAVAPRS